MTSNGILEIDYYCKKSNLSNTYFEDIFNHLSLGKFEYDQCLINNNIEVLKTEVRKFLRFSLSNRFSGSNSNDDFIDQTFIPNDRCKCKEC